MADDVYTALAHFLDNLPGGFPATESGVDRRILKRLFTPDEAALELHLSLLAETPHVIAHRAQQPVEDVAQALATMESKGLIYGNHKEGKEPSYTAIPFVVGIYEFQLHKMDRELAGYFDEYLPHLLEPETWKKAPLLRTIPVGESISPELEVMPYEQAEALVRSHTTFSVADCVCRQEEELLGHRCDKPMETCLSFGSGADFYVHNQMGRYITQEEALDLLALAEESGLVLQPSASEEAAFICCCCGCCCGVLTSLKQHPNPAELVHSAFVAVLDEDLCTGCELCFDRCQMDALTPSNGSAALDVTRCIGCGLCVSACPDEALVLMRKPESEQRSLPATWTGANIRLGKTRGVMSNRSLAEMVLRSKVDRAAARRN
jgi:electron transport complex protein RnfB